MATPLSAIMLGAKDRADLLNNSVVGDPTWRRWANQGQERLYRMLVVKAPGRFHKSQTFTLTGLGGNTTALAADFRSLREGGVTKDPSVPAARLTLRRYPFGERDARGQLMAWGFGRELAFDIQAGNLIIEPASLCAGNYAYYYLAGPVPFDTTGGGDATNIAAVLEPYVDFVETDMAIKGALKDESYELAGELKAEQQQRMDEIAAEFNDTSDPSTIIDVDNVGGTFWP
jgi:hypothetical protein